MNTKEHINPENHYDILLANTHEQSSQTGYLTQIQLPEGVKFTGAISIHNRGIEEDQMKEAVKYSAMCYVMTEKGNGYIRCIDERGRVGYIDVNDFANYLGPQTPGGTVMAAIPFVLSSESDGKNLVDAMAEFNQTVAEKLFSPGGHNDDHSDLEEKTGCGAIDTALRQIQILSEIEKHPDVLAVVAQLLGDNYDPEVINKVSADTQELIKNNGLDQIMPKKPTQPLDNIEGQAGKESVETKSGPHNGIGLIINMVEGTTFHTDHFSNKFDSKIQMFNWDIWYDFHIANEIAKTKGKEFASEFIHAKVASALITWTLLTDGSLKTFVRQANNQTPEPTA